jgi:hypothetical protein
VLAVDLYWRSLDDSPEKARGKAAETVSAFGDVHHDGTDQLRQRRGEGRFSRAAAPIYRNAEGAPKTNAFRPDRTCEIAQGCAAGFAHHSGSCCSAFIAASVAVAIDDYRGSWPIPEKAPIIEDADLVSTLNDY